MRTILFGWELGGGLGHLMRAAPLAKALCDRGHRVVVAVRDLSRAKTILSDDVGELLQAPVKVSRPTNPVHPVYTFAHILHNIGYAEDRELAGLAEGWRTLLKVIQPDLIIFDHSPTALLAARGFSARRVVIGHGFFCVPDQYPLPNLRSWEQVDTARLKHDEDQVLTRINHVLNRYHELSLDRIGQLYSEVDDTFLTTFREVDHYSDRTANLRYRGIGAPTAAGKASQWPAGTGKRIYAYLKNFPALPHLLEHLKHLGNPTLIFASGLDVKLQKHFASPTLRFENEPLDLKQVSSECDLAILNGTHNTACAMLLAGKPSLQLPLFLEQGMFAGAVCRLGAGVKADITNPSEIIAALTRLLESPQFAVAAENFARNYSTFDPALEHDLMVDRFEEILSQT